jgi:hypothetical protein
MSDAEFRHLYGKARDAQRGGFDAWCVQSTGEKAAVALILNKADWLERMGYTMVEAIERAGPEWVSLMPRVVRSLENDA